MHKPHTAICPEGAAAIGFTAFSALLCSILQWWAPAIVFWGLCWFSLHFFRDPQRVAPQAPGLAVSPADGTVIRIAQRPDPFSGEPVQCISIFMSVFNVHINRAPVACEVKSINYIPGKFFNASFDKASEHNERCAWLMEDEEGKNWTIVQIAGLIARRIVAWAEPEDELARGQRLGMIRFGSRVDLYLPVGYVPSVDMGAKVFGGQTIVARKS